MLDIMKLSNKLRFVKLYITVRSKISEFMLEECPAYTDKNA